MVSQLIGGASSLSRPAAAPWWQAGTALWTSVVLLTAGTLALRTGYQPARYYMVGWTLLLVAVVNYYLSEVGLLPHFGFWTMHGVHLASALEMILLSLGLADRINLAKKDRQLAQEEALRALQAKEAAQTAALAALQDKQPAQTRALQVSAEKEELQQRSNRELAERAAELQRAYQELQASIRTSHQLQELAVYATIRHTEALRWNAADQNWAGTVSCMDVDVQLLDISRCQVCYAWCKHCCC